MNVKVEANGRITNGQDADVGQFPTRGLPCQRPQSEIWGIQINV